MNSGQWLALQAEVSCQEELRQRESAKLRAKFGPRGQAVHDAIGEKRVGELSPMERLQCGLNWMVANEGYGIKGAAEDLLDRLREFVHISADPAAPTRAYTVCLNDSIQEVMMNRDRAFESLLVRQAEYFADRVWGRGRTMVPSNSAERDKAWEEYDIRCHWYVDDVPVTL